MQRYFGGLKKSLDPKGHFSGGAAMLSKIKEYGLPVKGKTFFEVGTGRVPLLPVAFWLGGAGKTITVDLNPYMRRELIEDMLYIVKTQEPEIRKIFRGLLDEDRFTALLNYSKTGKVDKKGLCALCGIDYAAPADAANTGLPEGSVDYHISNAVYEHIPLEVIRDILAEGNRIIANGGLFINTIDYGDHFSYMDGSISVINFLQYRDAEWAKYAGNRYMYMNRARHDDFVELFKAVGHEFLEVTPVFNQKAWDLLEQNAIVPDSRFKTKGRDILAITGSRFITRKRLLSGGLAEKAAAAGSAEGRV
jgi:SAM-dependent methyltransferase